MSDLSAGVHDISFTVEDGVGESCMDTVEILGWNSLGRHNLGPLANSVHSFGEEIVFSEYLK